MPPTHVIECPSWCAHSIHRSDPRSISEYLAARLVCEDGTVDDAYVEFEAERRGNLNTVGICISVPIDDAEKLGGFAAKMIDGVLNAPNCPPTCEHGTNCCFADEHRFTLPNGDTSVTVGGAGETVTLDATGKLTVTMTEPADDLEDPDVVTSIVCDLTFSQVVTLRIRMETFAAIVRDK